jgi:peptide/nickel transport system permease protein
VKVLGRRLTFYLLTAILAVTVDFLLPRVLPGNPLDAILAKVSGGTLTKASLQAL